MDRLHRTGLIGGKLTSMNVEAPEPGQFSSNPDFRRDDDDGWQYNDGETLGIKFGD